MSEARKLAAILVADVVGYSRLAGADEEGTVASLRVLRSGVIDPVVAARRGRVVKSTGDGAIVEFRSAVDAVRCGIEIQNGMAERNAGLAEEKRIVFRIGIHVGDVIEEMDGDLMGDGVNVAARLEGLCEPGGVCLSSAAHEHVAGRVAVDFADLGEQALKNIARPIRGYALTPAAVAAASVDQLKEARASPSPPLGPERPEPPRLSIVVLPFANIGGDPEQDYFVDGVTENLTTDLSRVRGSFVIARNTAFAYKDKAFDATKIGRELNVRYALEGSVQRSGNRMRINVQLVDAQSGNHLWAERFEKPMTDLFEMQDEVVARIANTLNAQLCAVEARRAERAPVPDSMDLYFQGEAWVNRGITSETMARAQDFFERALALDPANVDALVGLAGVHATVAMNLSTDDRVARLAAAEAGAAEALSLAPDHPRAHLCIGMVLGISNRAAQGIAEYERAMALDQNLVGAHALIGLNKIFIGRAEETEAHVLEALRLSPRDPWVYTYFVAGGWAASALGRPEEAVSWLRRSIECNRNFPLCRYLLAATLASLDRMEEARSEVAAGLSLDREFTIAKFESAAPSDNPIFLAQRARLIDDMRRAGVPEA
jgi:TolB-like protein/Tfp pilus assembly protein PilF